MSAQGPAVVRVLREGQSSRARGTSAAGSRRCLVLALCATASVLSYAALLSVLPGLNSAEPSYAFEVFPWIRPLPLPALAAMREAGGAGYAAAAFRFLGLLVIAFAAYGMALRTVSGPTSPALEAAVFSVGVAFQALAVTAPALLSSDVYSYASHGESVALHHVAPTVDPSPLRPDDVYVRLTHGDYPTWPYGPIWSLVSGGIVWLCREQVGRTVFLFRSLAAAAALGTSVAIWGCLRRIAPHRTARGLVFFLWNPLVFLEVGVGSHNDAVMVALFALGGWLHVRGRRGAALTAFTLSTLVKLATGPLVPIYALMVLRRSSGWPERWRFLGRGLGGAAMVTALSFGLLRACTRSGPDPASSPVRTLASLALCHDFNNSIHELACSSLRVALGEAPDDVHVPSWFIGWWVSPREGQDLRAGPALGAEPLGRVGPGRPLLVIAPHVNSWVRVYNLETRSRGYIEAANLDYPTRPPEADADPDVVAWMEFETGSSPTARRVNTILRGTTWLLFVLCWCMAAWYATGLRRFLVAATSILLASYWLVGSWIWPWYLLWALAPAALVSDSRPALLAAITSATVLSLYTTIDAPGWVHAYRSLPAFVLPLAIFGLALTAASWARWSRAHDGGMGAGFILES